MELDCPLHLTGIHLFKKGVFLFFFFYRETVTQCGKMCERNEVQSALILFGNSVDVLQAGPFTLNSSLARNPVANDRSIRARRTYFERAEIGRF